MRLLLTGHPPTACAIGREVLAPAGFGQLVRDLEALPTPGMLSTCQSGDHRP